MRFRSHVFMGLLTLGWLGLVTGGFALWEQYDHTPGSKSAVPPSPVNVTGGRCVKLVLFAHPHCPCTRASLDELAELTEKRQPEWEVTVEFVRPKGAPAGWERTASWDKAAAIPGVTVRGDAGGVRAREAGATTSGHLMAFDEAGRTLFSGGITQARGRKGPSAGRRAIRDLLAGIVPEARETPVYGCPLFGPEEHAQAKKEGVACP